MEELKPCPACGHTNLEIIECEENPPSSYVRCDYCGLQTGPTNEFSPNVVTEWNTLPRRLKWTREKPTQEGWYWLKEEGRHAVVKMTAGGMISEPYVRHVNEVDGEWAGPIPEPEK